MNQLQNIKATFLSPRRAFVALLERPRALLAVLLLCAAGLGVHLAVSARIDLEAQVRITAQELASEPGKQPSETDVQKEATRALNVRRILGYISVLVGVPLLVLVPAILFWLPCRFSRRRVPLKNCYAIGAHVWLPFGLRQLMAVPVILKHPGLDPMHTRGLFKTDLGALAPLPGAFLVDPFWIWMAVLFALAGRAAGWKTWKAALLGTVLWLILGLVGRMLV